VCKSNLADGYGLDLSILQSFCEQTGATLIIKFPMARSHRAITAYSALPKV
jgi:hypothetical protein